MRVSWDRLTLVELKGLGSYVIRYIRSDRKEQTQEKVITVSWTKSNITIDNLQPGVQYDVTVAVSSEGGISCECITLKPLAQWQSFDLFGSIQRSGCASTKQCLDQI